jgi:ribosomal protein L34E
MIPAADKAATIADRLSVALRVKPVMPFRSLRARIPRARSWRPRPPSQPSGRFRVQREPGHAAGEDVGDLLDSVPRLRSQGFRHHATDMRCRDHIRKPAQSHRRDVVRVGADI